MATITAAAPAVSLSSAFAGKALITSTDKARPVPAAGLPAFQGCNVRSSTERKEEKRSTGHGSWALSLASAVAALHGSSTLALVDERLSTEGTGLGLGLSNPLLIWILLGVTTIIWALYFVYSSSLPEGDDDSGLSL